MIINYYLRTYKVRGTPLKLIIQHRNFKSYSAIQIMTLYQFNALDEMEQMEAIWNAAKIADRKDAAFHYNLYQIDKFYVEEQIHIEWNVRKGFKTFITTELLQPYLDNVSLNISG